MALPPYSYQKLQPGEIRILTLLPGQRDELLTCSLEPMKLADTTSTHPEAFEALSYAWQSAQKPNILFIDGYSIPITASLHSALKRLRLPDRNRLLWADAVCINQDNTTEKEQQVGLMARIYSTARRVVVDLGEASEDTETTLQLIDEYWRTVICAGTLPGDYGRELDAYEGATFLGLSPTRDVNMKWKTHVLPPDDSAEWIPVNQIFQRPWFMRLWVVQEFVLAKEVVVYIGTFEVNWRHLYALTIEYDHEIGFPFTVGTEDSAGFESFTFMAHHRGLRELQHSVEGRKLLGSLKLPSLFRRILRGEWVDLLHVYRYAHCSVQRDRFYALLSVTSREMGDISEIRPDYTTKDLGWLLKMSHFLIGLEDGCEAIMHGGIGVGKVGVGPDAPSWMLGFGRPRESGVIMDLSDIDEASRAAGTDSKFSVVHTAQQPDEITIKAYRADRIVSRVAVELYSARAEENWTASGNAWIDITKLIIGRVFQAFLEQYANGKGAESSTCLDRSALEGMVKAMIVNSDPSVPFIGKTAQLSLLVLGIWLCIHDQELDGPSGWRQCFLDVLQSEYGFDMGTDRENKNEEDLTAREDQIEAVGSLVSLFQYAIASGMEPAITENGPFASMPRGTQVGDQIWIVSGCRLPAVLRRSTSRPGTYRLIGFCHVHGIMVGEALEQDGFDWNDVVLF